MDYSYEKLDPRICPWTACPKKYSFLREDEN
jgi:hypothetical protein